MKCMCQHICSEEKTTQKLMLWSLPIDPIVPADQSLCYLAGCWISKPMLFLIFLKHPKTKKSWGKITIVFWRMLCGCLVTGPLVHSKDTSHIYKALLKRENLCKRFSFNFCISEMSDCVIECIASVVSWDNAFGGGDPAMVSKASTPLSPAEPVYGSGMATGDATTARDSLGTSVINLDGDFSPTADLTIQGRCPLAGPEGFLVHLSVVILSQWSPEIAPKGIAVSCW